MQDTPSVASHVWAAIDCAPLSRYVCLQLLLYTVQRNMSRGGGDDRSYQQYQQQQQRAGYGNQQRGGYSNFPDPRQDPRQDPRLYQQMDPHVRQDPR
jgi:hypothetical protein